MITMSLLAWFSLKVITLTAVGVSLASLLHTKSYCIILLLLCNMHARAQNNDFVSTKILIDPLSICILSFSLSLSLHLSLSLFLSLSLSLSLHLSGGKGTIFIKGCCGKSSSILVHLSWFSQRYFLCMKFHIPPAFWALERSLSKIVLSYLIPVYLITIYSQFLNLLSE